VTRVPAGSAAAALLHPEAEVYANVAGFRLLYATSGELPLLRIYELEAPVPP